MQFLDRFNYIKDLVLRTISGFVTVAFCSSFLVIAQCSTNCEQFSLQFESELLFVFVVWCFIKYRDNFTFTLLFISISPWTRQGQLGWRSTGSPPLQRSI
jgi:hypothetical protein